MPAGVGESSEGQKASKSAIGRAVKASQAEADDEWGPGQPIAKSRPQSALNVEHGPALLAFSRWAAGQESDA